MKKLLLIIFIAIATTAFAQKMSVVLGNFDFLKDQTEVNVELKFEGVQILVENITEEQYLERRKKDIAANPKKAEQDWVKWNNEWQQHKKIVYLERFLRGLNKSKKITFNKDIKSKYTLIVESKWIFPGWHGGFIVQPAKLTSDLKFVETDNPSNILLVLHGDKIEGTAAKNNLVMEYGRIAAAYETTGKKLGTEIKRALK